MWQTKSRHANISCPEATTCDVMKLSGVRLLIW
ncbi:hypothetical protein BRADI_4g12802v3 [Brachypodium distachyon]|uniref:Uncharacterized protein n=1 Tax=Brachypodium distachyon TaxID=15368 RepID=A0A0Q3PEE5_BRADI|nr:hypothetical protein BRADI_4g12802v3 [Brachypodium distachyon]